MNHLIREWQKRLTFKRGQIADKDTKLKELLARANEGLAVEPDFCRVLTIDKRILVAECEILERCIHELTAAFTTQA